MLFKLLGTPITAPMRGIAAVVRTIHNVAYEQYSSPDAIRAEIVRLEGLLDSGEITEEEFEDLEDVLLDRLEAAEDAAAQDAASTQD